MSGNTEDEKEGQVLQIEKINNKSHGLSPPSGFSLLSFDQVVPYYSQRHKTPSTFCINKTVRGFLK